MRPHRQRRALALLALLLAAGVGRGATPDISGPWEFNESSTTLRSESGDAPPLTAQGKLLYQRHRADPQADPIEGCLPPGIPRALMQHGYPFNIVVGRSVVGMMIQWNHLPRVIYLNKDHFENIGPEYLGQSVGHWQGSTLIVDTTGYNDSSWLDASGLPHSDALHTLERIRLKDRNTLEDRISFEDPSIFSQPWTSVLTFRRRPGVIIQEDYCLGRLGKGVTVSH
jgi:hypothetical protein